MFGLLLSGRMVDTSFRAVGPSHVLIDIENIDSCNHVVIFLTGQQPFPAGMGGAVYFSWPASDPAGPAEASWQFLGTLSNAKPSAIFKIGRVRKPDYSLSESLVARFGGQSGGGQRPPLVAQLGISMEPLTQLEGLSGDAQTEATAVPAFVEFSQKMVENLFNYASSFAVSAGEMRMRPSETFVPFSSLQQWYANFERRLQQNPYFWRT